MASRSSATTDGSLNPLLSKSSLNVTGRVFLITGGTQGLGLEVARLLKELGAAAVVLVSRSIGKGEAACSELSSDRFYSFWLEADLSLSHQASAVVDKAVHAVRHIGPITGVVNAAATTGRGSLANTSSSEFDFQMAVNVRAPFLITQAAARHMQVSNIKGAIVNVCSVAAHGGAPFVMAYSASKAALVNLTKNNAAELAPSGIRVNGVNMGWCFTENENALQSKLNPDWLPKADATVPLGRILRPRDVATTICFLLSDASALMTGNILELHPEYAHGMLSLSTNEYAR